MLKYTAIVIDDEITNTNLIKHFIAKFLPSLTIIGEATNVEEGINLINKKKPEILFLDIQLYEKDAFDILDNIDFSEIEIIFVTAYENYALKAFKYNAVDYIMKPLSIEDLIIASNKCVQRIEEKKIFEKKTFNDDKKKINSDSKHITISSTERVDIIKKDDIVFCKSDGRYTTFYMKNKEEYVASKNLGEYEILFEKDYFFRIHHSYIINLDHLITIIKKTGYYCEMTNNISLPIAKRRQESLRVFLKLKKNT